MTLPKENIFTDVAKATVTLVRNVGQGVLVNSNLIITAAHCIDFRCDGAMVLGDYFIEKIMTGEGEMKVAPLAVEPINDIAVLGSLDNQDFSKEARDFERFCEHTKPVPLCRSDFVLYREFRVHIYTHIGTWVTGSAKQCGEDDPTLFYKADEQIKGGTSGGPIINDSGELVGIASNFSDQGDDEKISQVPEEQYKCYGHAPYPHLALPVWVCRRIFGRKF